MADIRMQAAIIFEPHIPTALRRALRYAGDDGFVASLPQLLHARANAPYDNIIWNTWFTSNSEECVVTTQQGNHVVVAVHGGGIFVDSGSTRIINLILWQNEDDLYFKQLSPASRPDHTNIGDGDLRGINGNISADPLFADPENGDFRLQPGSPCIDSGDPELIYNDHDGSRNDMGAFGGPEGPNIVGEGGGDE